MYVREMVLVNGKVKVASQVYIGPPERVVELMRGGGDDTDVRLRVEEFGSLWAALQMDVDIDIASIILKTAVEPLAGCTIICNNWYCIEVYLEEAIT